MAESASTIERTDGEVGGYYITVINKIKYIYNSLTALSGYTAYSGYLLTIFN